MDKFTIMNCSKQEKPEHNYSGYTIGLCNIQNPHFVIFFPVVEECAHLVNFLLNPGDKEIPVDVKTLSIFKTMSETWRISNRFLSGIVMDVLNEQDGKEGMIIVNIYLSDTNSGKIEAIIPVNFLHAVVIASMEQTPIIMTDSLLHTVMPDDDSKNETPPIDDIINKPKSKKKYPKDKNIIDIAKKIMSGKIK